MSDRDIRRILTANMEDIMSVPDKIIELAADCCPMKNPEPVGVQPRDVRWRVDATPAVPVIKVEIDNPDGYWDLPGRRDGADYVIHYNGAPAPLKRWTYSTRCQGGTTCPKLTPPEMTNGPG